MPALEFWYDPRHTGALRVVDHRAGRIRGSDPSEADWSVTFRRKGPLLLVVDFSEKHTHRGQTNMVARYAERRSRLMWPDGNMWWRVRVDPRRLICGYA